MFYLTKYLTAARYEAVKDSLLTPHIALTESDNTTHYINDYSIRYLTFVALESGTFKFSGNSIDYSLDNGETWTTLASDTNSPTVNAGGRILWKASGLTPISGTGIGTFSSTCKYDAEGNPMSLLFGDNFVGQTSLSGKNYAIQKLFRDSTKLNSVENLVLPATTLSTQCYMYMFSGCTALTTSLAELPAQTLSNQCYEYMFRNCKSLTNTPILQATSTAQYCYYQMFQGCTSLTDVPSSITITSGVGCCLAMFRDCTSLTTVPQLIATSMPTSACSQMFRDCTSLTTVPSKMLSATTLSPYCYRTMFYGCKSLTTAPELPAATLADSAYLYMFSGCTSLNSITCLATDISATDCTTDWVNGVASRGTFTKDENMSSWTTGVNGIPTNWTVQDYSSSGYQEIDLGLPSGTKWADRNIGASGPTDYGDSFYWGETPQSQSWYSGPDSSLPASYDMATQLMGNDWHLPTEKQIDELIESLVYVEDNGTYVTLKYKEGTMDMPKGVYWSNERYNKDDYAYTLEINGKNIQSIKEILLGRGVKDK